jgi:hypothetical protein
MLEVMRAAADDRLVLAAGAACWWAAKDRPGPYLERPRASVVDYDPHKAAGL